MAEARKVRFIHVFGNRPETVQRLQLSSDASAPPPVGDAFPLSREGNSSEEELAGTFGPAFAADLQALPVGPWSEVTQSNYGWHRVRVLNRTQAQPASLEDVHGQVVLDCTVARRAQAVHAFLERAFERYQIDIDGRPAPAPQPTGRLGMRSEPSGEDG